jgi:flagellar protein FliO/FliZ
MLVYLRLIPPLCLFCLSAQTALAGEQPPFSLSASIRLFWGLLIVLGILLIVYALVRKRLSFLNGGGKGVITIVEMRHLMPKKSLCLIRVRGREYLLGLGNDRISLIAALPSTPDEAPTPTDDKSFAEVLTTAATEETTNETAKPHDRSH